MNKLILGELRSPQVTGRGDESTRLGEARFATVACGK